MANLSHTLSLDEYTLIISEIDTWDQKSRSSVLKVLALTCRFFVPLCQKRLFSRIKYSPYKVDTFLDILCTSPYLADYIGHLDYRSYTDTGDNTIRFLDKLNNLLSLCIRTFGDDWKALDPQLSNAFLRLISSPNLRSLQLDGLRNFPVQSLLKLGNSAYLETLDIRELGIDLGDILTVSTTLDASNSSSTIIQLSKFKVFTGSASAVNVLMGGSSSPCRNPPVFDFSRMRELCTEWCHGDDVIVGKLLIGCAPFLEDLKCTFRYGGSTVESFSGLAEAILKGPSQTLRRLRFDTNEVPVITYRDPFYGIVAELGQLAGQTKGLESIEMEFYIRLDLKDDPYGPDRLFQAILHKCTPLDDLLADRIAFPKLRCLSVRFATHLYDGTNVVVYDPVLWPQLNDAARTIKRDVFRNVKAMSTIDFSFNLVGSYNLHDH
ncbi:hypothetical protein BJ912DRAFT_963344 [Pholiota molesta]|nr:hypothetical protein BJ912DRAFT_963344 [Pholiota molesta]